MNIEKLQLLYNAAAHFAACEKYPETGLVEELRKKGVESFDAMFWALAETAKQAELYRRFMGESAHRILTEDEWRLIIKPGQMAKASEFILKAVLSGLGDGSDDDVEIDEVLMELEKKTGRTG